MEEQGFVIKNNYFKTLNAYYSANGDFKVLHKAEIFTDEVSCQMAIMKICHTYKDVESYQRENLEMKKVTIKVIE